MLKNFSVVCLVTTAIAVLALQGCTKYSGYYREGQSYLDTYTKHVRWSEGEAAIREDIQDFVNGTTADNFVRGYLERNGVDGCHQTVGFQLNMYALGYVESLGDKEVFCVKDGLGIYLTFRKDGAAQVVLEAVDIFPSYKVLTKKELLAMAEIGRAQVMPDRLFLKKSMDKHAKEMLSEKGITQEEAKAITDKFDIGKAQFVKLLDALPYDVALIPYIEKYFNTTCREEIGYGEKYKVPLLIKFECGADDEDTSAYIKFDKFGQNLLHLILSNRSKDGPWQSLSWNRSVELR